jgi:cytochrome c553
LLTWEQIKSRFIWRFYSVVVNRKDGAVPMKLLCLRKIVWLACCWLGVLGFAGTAMASTPQAELARWQQAAGQSGDASRGQAFFNRQHGGEWSCASCHGQPPTREGKHASTGKTITPLAPAVNPQRLTDTAKVDKWLRRNCKDVLSRECTAIEKADVLAYLISLK